MASDLPKSGVSLVVENAKQAVSDLNSFQQALGKQNKAVASVSQASAGTSRYLNALSKDFNNISQSVLRNIPGLGKFSNLLGSLGSSATAAGEGAAVAAEGTAALGTGMSAALPVIGATVLAIGAATAGFYAFWKAGSRGAQLQNTIEAFSNIVGKVQDSTEVLEGLRKATRGTISDMELMRLTTQALQGTSVELRSVLLKTENGVTNLGKVFDITARAARASGQNVEVVQEKFITGLRLMSKKRLDDIGVVFDSVKANEEYAKSIGKTAASLTDAEKQIAFTNAALKSLNQIAAEAPISSLQDALARIGVAFANIRDKIELAIQPIFAPIAELVGDIVNLFEQAATRVIQFFAPVFKVIGAIISETIGFIKEIIADFLGGFSSDTSSALDYVIAAWQLLGDAVILVFKIMATTAKTVIKGLSDVFKALLAPLASFFSAVGDTTNSNLTQLAFNLGKGGAAIIGAFATGIIKGGTYVLQAVTAIAQIVADFLMGFSPPKRGVLHDIDKGAENVAVSWTDGFMGGIQKSFGEVLSYVNDRLGDIASLSRDQIETRLAQLDVALRPFKENLAIVKADMEAIAGFTDPALKIMERQRTSLLKAFGRGDKGLDIEQLRNQDRQIQRLKELKDLGQDQVDQAELQLALANSQQAQERALLGIALDRMGAEEKAASATENASKAVKDATEKAKGGGGAGAAEDGGAGMGLGGGETPDLLSSAAIDAAKQNILNAIGQLPGLANSAMAGAMQGLSESGIGGALGGLNAQKGALQKQLGRIGESNPVKAISDKFSGLKDAVSGAINDFKTFIEDTFSNLFGENGSVSKTLDSIKNTISNTFSEGGALSSISSAFTTMKGIVDPIIKSLFSSPDGLIITSLTSIKNKFEEVFTGESSPLQTTATKFTELKDAIQDAFGKVFEFDISGAAATVYDVIAGVFDTVKLRVANLTNSDTITNIKDQLKNLVSSVLESVQVIDVDSFVSGFEDVLSRIKDAIESFPTDTIQKGLSLASAIGGVVMNTIGNAVGLGGGNDQGGTENPVQQNTQNLLAGLEISLPEDIATKLGDVGKSITAAIAAGISAEDSLAPVSEALATLYEMVSSTLTSLFIGEDSALLLAQVNIINFVTVVSEQLLLLQDSFQTNLMTVDSYLRSVFLNDDAPMPSIPTKAQGVMNALINQFMRLTNDGEGTLKGALATFGDVLHSVMVNPMAAAADGIANAVVEALNGIIKQFNRLPIQIDIPLLQHISINPGSFAKGTLDAINSPFYAGERGKKELIVPQRNNPLSVFPNKATMALDRIGSLMQRMSSATAPPPKPMPMPIYLPPQASVQNNSTDTSYNNSNNRNVTQNFKYAPTKLELAQMRAGLS